ncbi:MlaD family protein [Deferribacteres bacterium DY0037]
MTDLPKAKKIYKRQFSIIWLTPILAVGIIVWLLYNGYVNSGKEIRVQFDTGAGLVIGKTPLKYRGITIGKVVDFEIADSLDKVVVVIKLDHEAAGVAKVGNKFWIVKPELSLDRVTGLETIISGSYIEVQPPSYDLADLESRDDESFFVGLKAPPRYEFSGDVVNVNLISESDPKLFRGMTVFHNSIEAGQILSVTYDNKNNIYVVSAMISSEYGQYINETTKFWNISGVDISLDASGFNLHTVPLLGAFQGGVAFDAETTGRRAEPLDEYDLYDNYEDTQLSRMCITLDMPDSYGVKSNRTPVMFKGVKVGLVKDVKLNNDRSGAVVNIMLMKKYLDLAAEGSRFVLRQPSISAKGVENIATAVTGVYLEIIAGAGEPKYEFTLAEEPVVDVPAGSIPIIMTADEKGSINSGSGIYFKGVRAGVVTGYRLEDSRVIFDAVIFKEFREIAVEGLYFWEADALKVRMSGEGVSIKTTPVAQILESAVKAGFFGARGKKPLERDTVLALYSDEDTAKEAYIAKQGIRKIYLITEDASSLAKGAPVLYKGFKVGELGNRFLDADTGKVRISAMIQPEYKKLVNDKTYFWKLGGSSVKFEGSEIKVSAPDIKEIVLGGVEFDNADAPLGSVGSVIYEDHTDAQKAVNAALSAEKVRLYSDKETITPLGAPVLYRGVKAGEVYSTGYDKKKKAAYADVILYREFSGTLTDTTRFWKSDSFSFEATGRGVDIKAEPIASYTTGALNYESFKKPVGTDIIYSDRGAAEAPDLIRVELQLSNASNLKRKAPVLCNGVQIGYVNTIAGDMTAELLIYEKYADFLREGAKFWIEDVKVSLEGFENVNSMIYGAKINMFPGSGEALFTFKIDDTPVSPYYGRKGLRLVLRSDSRSSLETGSPVYYRQVPAGGVEWVRLADDGSRVEVGIFIEDKYRHLVRSVSVFESVSGINARFGLFSGFRLKTGSAKSILMGGVSFTTENMDAPEAEESQVFELKTD